MGGFVGVDPKRVRLLANRLKDLEAALAKHGPAIKKKFRDWHGDLDLSLISEQATAVGDDGSDMSKRAALARNLDEHGDVGLCTPDGNLINIPWDMKDVKKQSPKEAKQEARDLNKALDRLQKIDLSAPNSPMETSYSKAVEVRKVKADARADIKAIAQSLTDHKDDPAYLTAFAAAGGVRDAARVGSALHQNDGTEGGQVLRDDSKKLIAQYAGGVNQIFKLQQADKIPPNPAYLKSLTDPPGGDMWSVGMLFKYGPKGDKWEPKALSKVSGAMLDWRREQKMRPDYVSGTSPPYSLGGYSDAEQSWYHSLGLDPDHVNKNVEENGKIVAGIRANDPAMAVISRLGENAEASRDLLGHNNADSKRYASDLLDHKWQTPGGSTVDDSDGPRRVLTLAATDRSPEHEDQSGEATDNILNAAVSAKKSFDGRDSLDKDQYPTYPKGTAVALAGITATWADDLGATSQSVDGPLDYTKRHRLASDEKHVKDVMKLFVKDNSAAAAQFDAALDRQISSTASNPKKSAIELQNLGNAAGILMKAKAEVEYSEELAKDEEAKRNLFWANSVVGLAGGMPGPKAPDAQMLARGLLYGQMLIHGGRATLTDSFDVDHASRKEPKNKEQARKSYIGFKPAIAEGLIRAGVTSEPVNEPWYDSKSKTVDPGAVKSGEFGAWWAEQTEKHSELGKADSDFGKGVNYGPGRTFDGN